MDAQSLAGAALAAIVVGMLIGSIGVGGVLLVPWLTHVGGVPVQQAAGIAMLAFIGPGLVALAFAIRAGGSRTAADWSLLLATAPGAFAGAAALAWMPERAALGVLASSVLVVGLRLLRGGAVRAATPARTVAGPAIGALTGFASGMTATSGPMVLVPLAVWRGVPLPDAIAIGQLVQLPIAVTASAGFLAAGSVDLATGATLGAILVPGTLLGQRLGRLLPLRALSTLLGAVLVAASIAFAARTIW
jgi:uncharacterized membrane protein YfcA